MPTAGPPATTQYMGQPQAAPALQSNYSVPGGTSGPMTPDQLALFSKQASGGGGNFLPSFSGAPAPAPVNPFSPQALAYYKSLEAQQPTQLDFMTPAMEKYVNQFKSSQAEQQQAINAGLVQALQGLGERRDAASKVAATVPGEFDKAYNEAVQSQQQAAANAGFGHPTIGANADQALITAANTQQKAAGHANQPLLEAGITADYSKGKTTLSNTHMQNQASIAQAQQAFDQQMLQAQAQWQQQQQAQQQGFAHDAAMAQLQSSLQTQQYQAEHPEAAQTPEQALQFQQRQQLDANAIKNGFTSYAEQQQAQNSGNFQRAVNVLSGKAAWDASNKIKAGDKQGLLKVIGNDPLVLKALVANGYLTANDIYGTPAKG